MGWKCGVRVGSLRALGSNRVGLWGGRSHLLGACLCRGASGCCLAVGKESIVSTWYAQILSRWVLVEAAC